MRYWVIHLGEKRQVKQSVFSKETQPDKARIQRSKIDATVINFSWVMMS